MADEKTEVSSLRWQHAERENHEQLARLAGAGRRASPGKKVHGIVGRSATAIGESLARPSSRPMRSSCALDMMCVTHWTR